MSRCVDKEGRVEDVAAALEAPAWVEQRPDDGQVATSLHDDGDGPLAVVIRPIRWGAATNRSAARRCLGRVGRVPVGVAPTFGRPAAHRALHRPRSSTRLRRLCEPPAWSE